ncbi:MAG: hypothetical protein ASARMPRED_007778 [Alectoria sarmentosa]|nr:MAG: hypothetical protein ASARMPRED_007778 [Alectoria sarmentosa]
MPLLLTTVILAVTALALPTSTNPILSRQIPQSKGLGVGELFSQLTFTTYAEPSCQGSGNAFTTAYGFFEAFQMQSYSLSRSLHANEVLDFYTGFGTGLQSKYSVDHAVDGHYTEACLQYDSTAGINATTNDDEGHGRWNGCHTLNNNEWCAMIWQS